MSNKIVTIHDSETLKVLRFGAVTDSPTEFTVKHGAVRFEAWTPVGQPLPALPDVMRRIAEAGDFDGPHTLPEPPDGWEVALRIDCAALRRVTR